jgi:hypothetical protein
MQDNYGFWIYVLHSESQNEVFINTSGRIERKMTIKPPKEGMHC